MRAKKVIVGVAISAMLISSSIPVRHFLLQTGIRHLIKSGN